MIRRRLIACLFIAACAGCSGDFASYHFSFPPESQPHSADGALGANVRVYGLDRPTPYRRQVWVGIRTKEGELLFGQHFALDAARPHVRADWQVEEIFVVHVRDDGTEPPRELGQIVIQNEAGTYRAIASGEIELD